MQCTVTGGGGFIGSHLVESLINVGHQVTVIDNQNARFLPELRQYGANVISGDYINGNFLEEAIGDNEVIFHLASTTVPKTSNENPIYDIETNLIGTVKLLNIAKNKHAKKIIFPSSGGTVYGKPVCTPINEKHPTNPISSYGIVKLAIEKYLHLFWTMYGIDYCILRVANAYGPRQLPNSNQGLIPTVIYRGLHNQVINIWGDGSAIRDYVYIADVVDALILAANYSGSEKLFNIGSGEGCSINEIIMIVSGLLRHGVDTISTGNLVTDVTENVLDISLAKRSLFWSPKVNLTDGISNMLNYFGYIR